MKKALLIMAAALLGSGLFAGSHWKIKDGTGSTTVRDSGSFKLDGTIEDAKRCVWAREDDRGFFLSFDRGGYVKVPHDAKLSFPKGFAAEIFFSCDLSKVASTNFMCLISKGDRYDRGYSIMIRRDGTLLVTLNGVPQNSYGLVPAVVIGSNRDTRLKVTCDNRRVRVYVNGKFAASYPVNGRFKDSGEALRLGSVEHYPFSGNIYDVSLGEFDGNGAKDEPTELEKLQNFRSPKVADPEGTVVVSDFTKFEPKSSVDLGNRRTPPHMYIIRRDAPFWGNGVSTLVYPASLAAAPDLVYSPGLAGKYDVYIAVRSTGEDAISQAVVGDRYFRIVSKGLGGKHRSYEVLLARDVEMTGKKLGLAASMGGFVGYFKLIPSANRRQNEVPDPAGSCVEAPRMTEKDLGEWNDRIVAGKFASGMFRLRSFVETRKCAEPSEESQKRGYQLFERDWMDLCFKNSVPTVDTGKASIRTAAAPGEFEPVTLCVRGLRDLGKMSLKCGSFTGPDGKPAEIECKIGVAEHLVKRMTNFTSNSEVMEAPIYIERTAELPKLEKGVTRQFWITLRAPEDAKPGLYRTELELTSATGVERIPLALEVYPFKLERHGLGFVFDGFVNSLAEYDMETVIRDHAEHGMTALEVAKKAFAFRGDSPDTAAIDWERSRLPEMMRLARKYGVDEFVKLFVDDLHNEAEKYGPHLEEVLTRMLLDLKKKAAENDWPKLYLMSFDEILSDTHLIPKSLIDVRLIRKLGMTNCNDHIWYKTSRPLQHVCDEFAPLNDVFMNRFNTKNFWYVDTWKEMQERCDKEGKKLFPYNSNNAVMFSQPAAARYSFGWFHRTAGKGSIGHSMWTSYEPYGDPYNDLDSWLTDWLCNYPKTATRNGGPAIDWESYREGADDMRYIATLEHRIAEAGKRGIDVTEEKALLEKLINSLDMKKFYAESTFITPKWTRTWTEDGKHYASGVYNVPTGWEFKDYHNARRALAGAIISIDEKLGRR